MHALDRVKLLAQDIKETEEYREYTACKEKLADEVGIMALIKEFKKLQMSVQMGAATGHPASSEDTSRFQQISSLLFTDERTRDYLMAEMRMQQLMAEIFATLTAASGIDLEFPS